MGPRMLEQYRIEFEVNVEKSYFILTVYVNNIFRVRFSRAIDRLQSTINDLKTKYKLPDLALEDFLEQAKKYL